MVNLECPSLNLSQLGELSVLQEIFQPNSTNTVDPKLLLRTGALFPPFRSSPSSHRKDQSISPPSVPLSVHELEQRGDPRPLEEARPLEGPRPHSESPANWTRPRTPPRSPVDIVNIAAEEISRKTIPEKSEEEKKGRVAWNLAGLVGHLPPTDMPHHAPYPGYPAPPAPTYPSHLLSHQPALPTEMPPSSGYNFAAAAMGVPGGSSLSSSMAPSVGESTPGTSNSGPPYKMEPADMAMYHYQSGAIPGSSGGDAHSSFHPGAAPIPTETDVMQTLHQYLGTAEMHLPEEGNPWLEHGGLHPGLLSHQEYPGYDLTGRGYTDRKKKIIKEWNKTNSSSPRPAETIASSADHLRVSYGTDFLQHPTAIYNPYIKEEPLRPEYHYAYGAYGADGLVNPYAHMPRREKRKKQEMLPGGNTLTRDERKALGLPIPCAEIINLPMDEFNDLLSKHELTEEQLTLCRDIRRRGKNKVAAQNCRKRKIDQIKQLETEVTRIKCRKEDLISDHEKLIAQKSTWSDLVKRLHDYVLKELGHDPAHWMLQMDHTRQVYILPRGDQPTHDPRTTQPMNMMRHPETDQEKSSMVYNYPSSSLDPSQVQSASHPT